MDENLRREIILENFQNPLNKEEVHDNSYKKYNSRNPNCIDNIDVYIKIEDNIIKDIKFMGEACAISTASTSIMIKNLVNKSIDEVKEYIDNFNKMCNELEYNEDVLNEGNAFSNIYKQSNRKNCALLPYKSIIKAIEEYETK